MATIERLPSGRWRAKVRRRGYRHLSRSFSTRARAERWAREVERALEDGETVALSALRELPTLAEALDRYEREVTPTKKSARDERYKIRVLQATDLAGRSLDLIQPHDVAQLRDTLLETRSEATVRRLLALLSHLYNTARREWGYAVENPVQGIRLPKPGRARDRRVSRREEALLLATARNMRSPALLAIMRLAIETGMRQGEILGLRWEHIDLDRRVAYLPDTKTGDSRGVPLSRRAVRALRRYARERGLTARQMRRGRVFSYQAGDGFRASWRRLLRLARARYEAACAAAGTEPDPAVLADLRFHDLRHEAASRLFELGLDAMEVATITGHKTMQMLRRYTHLRAENLVRKLDGGGQG